MPGLDWISAALRQRADEHLLRALQVRGGPQGREISLQGQRLLNFGSNDYLGLAGDPRLARAAHDSLAQSGWGSGASPLIEGRTDLHAELERRLAEFEQTESALVFASGLAANVGTVACLVDRQDAVFSDALNHASLIDGCRLSGAVIHVYRHGDVQHLRALLDKVAPARRRLIVSDSLFSMDGDFAPVADLCEVAEDYDAMLLLDEAHATGVWGENGRGAAERAGVEERVPIRVGTLSKALGSSGGFVSGSAALIQWCANQARTFVFSTAAPAATCAAALAALEIVRDEPQRRQSLIRDAKSLRDALEGLGLSTGASQSQIIPLVLGNTERTMQIAQQLRERGIFVPGIRPPSVPADASRLRISLTAAHRQEDREQLLDALRDIL